MQHTVDQSVLESLPLPQRQKLCRHLRQKQIQHYNEWIQQTPATVATKQPRRQANKRVDFEVPAKVKDATANFDDREVLKYKKQLRNLQIHSAAGQSLLHKCVVEDNVSAMELLLGAGVAVDAADRDGWTALHYAARLDRSDAAALLLQHGASLAVADVDGLLPLDHAPEGSGTAGLLEDAHNSQGLSQEKAKEVRRRKCFDMLRDVKKLIAKGQSVNMPNEDGITLLHQAAGSGFHDVVALLLSTTGVTVDAADGDGNTALHAAAMYAQSKTVKLLLQNRANPSCRNHEGCTPADVARIARIQEVLLRAQGKAVEVADPRGEDLGTATSKVIVSSNLPLSKRDELFEAEHQFGVIAGDDEPLLSNLTLTTATAGDTATTHVDLAARDDDDLVKLSITTVENIVSVLHERYNKHIIYTNVGEMLLALNPYKQLDIYTNKVSAAYASPTAASLPPHIFRVAQAAYRAAVTSARPQTCVVTGDSGAGKTETAKYFIQHVLSVAVSAECGLNTRVHQAAPVLEALGNAGTVANHNSSRFARHLTLSLSQQGHVLGGELHCYLLEKSRVVRQTDDGRDANFHVFYLMFAGISDNAERAKLALLQPEQYTYLTRSGFDVKKHIASYSAERFSDFKDSLLFVGFTNQDVDNLLTCLSAVLLLGNISFSATGNNDRAAVNNMDVLRTVANILQVPVGDLTDAFTFETTTTRGEQIRREFSVARAEETRDAMATAIYTRLFSWVVNGVNQMIGRTEDDSGDSSGDLSIGVLDIFGFENFSENGFAQLCINLTNERLEALYHARVFAAEARECAEEGIAAPAGITTPTHDVINMLTQKPSGVLPLLDEECRFPSASDRTLAHKLHSVTGSAFRSVYRAPRDSGLAFTVVHYAGPVTYSLVGVLNSNRDLLPPALTFTLKTSDNLLVRELFQTKVMRTGSLAPSRRQQRSRHRHGVGAGTARNSQKHAPQHSNKQPRRRAPGVVGTERKGPATLAFYFKNSLAELVARLEGAECHFVRCVAPRDAATAGSAEKRSSAAPGWSSARVSAQLHHTGVLSALLLRRRGFPLRLTPAEFTARFPAAVIGGEAATRRRAGDSRLGVELALSLARITDHKFGKTKVFLKSGHGEKLEDFCAELNAKVTVIQKAVRARAARCVLRRLRETSRLQTTYIGRFLQHAAAASSSLTRNLTRCDDIVEHSLAALDQVLTVYDDARSVPQPQYGGDLPPPPPELLPTQPPGAGADGAGAGCVKRAAPPLPKRSPDTRLSTSSADGGGPLLAPQQPDNPVVDFYPDCESGPESGYITPADQGSESEYPAINLATQYVREYYPHQVSAHYPPPPQPQKTTPPAAAQPQPPLYAQSPKIIMRSNSVCSASEDYTYDRHIDGVFVPPASSASPPPPPPPAEFQTADLFPPPPMDAAAPQTFPKPSKVAAPSSSSSASSEPHALPFKVSLKPVSSSSSSSAQSSLLSSSSGGGGSPPLVGSLPPPPPPAPPAVPPPPPVTVAKQPQTIDRSVKPAASSTSGAADDGDAAHAALINQIQSGITLRHSPLAAKIYTSPAPSSGSPDSPEDRAAVSSPGGKVAPPTAPKTKAAPPLGMRVGGQQQQQQQQHQQQQQQQQQQPPPVDPLAEASLPPTSPSHQIAAPAGIDVTELPGYTPIPENCPVWKRALLEKKNNQILETAKMELLAKKAEEEKWRDVPAWKKNLILEKEKKKEKEPGVLQAPSESDRRRMEEENRRLESMPDWKRKLVLQKRTD